MPTVLTDENFLKEVLENMEPVLVEIAAQWCGTCHIMAPILETLESEYAGRIKFCKLDMDSNEWVAREYGVTDLPFLLFFKNGQVVDNVVGVASRKDLTVRLKALLQTRY